MKRGFARRGGRNGRSASRAVPKSVSMTESVNHFIASEKSMVDPGCHVLIRRLAYSTITSS
jgi:hypothetical protein